MTFAEFAEIFAVLAMQLRANDTDEPTARAYYKILKDTPLSLVRLAADEFARTGTFFPKTSEWLKETQRIRQERREWQTEYLRDLHRDGQFLCEKCQDTHWIRNVEQNNVKQCECGQDRRDEVVGLKALPEYD